MSVEHITEVKQTLMKNRRKLALYGCDVRGAPVRPRIPRLPPLRSERILSAEIAQVEDCPALHSYPRSRLAWCLKPTGTTLALDPTFTPASQLLRDSNGALTVVELTYQANDSWNSDTPVPVTTPDRQDDEGHSEGEPEPGRRSRTELGDDLHAQKPPSRHL